MNQPALADTASLPFPIRLKSASKRGVDARSLRPGDWLRMNGVDLCVLQNYARARRIEVWYGIGYQRVHSWDSFLWLCEVVGHGRRRRWHALLPASTKRWVCEFGRPAK